MRTATKIWLIVAASLLAVGLIMFATAMAIYHWDFSKLNMSKYQTNIHAVLDSFQTLSIQTDTADIVFLPSEDGDCRVVCQEREHTKHSVYVEENQLVIRMVDERRWYHHLFNFGSDKITVYLPANQYASLSIHTSTGGITIPQDFQFDSIDIATSTGNVENKASATQSMKIKTSTGNIRVENISTTTLDLSVTTGKITATSVTCLGDMNIRVSTGKTYLTQVSCQNMTTNGSTGDVSMRQVVVTDKMSVERSTGDVTFEDCDASDILVVTDTGSVKGTLLSEKVFIAKSDTGRIQVPETTSGGKCKVTTDTGNIKFEIKQ